MTPEMTQGSSAKPISFCCLYCVTGKEQELVSAIIERYPAYRATAVMQTKRHTQKGVTTLQNDVILKGYVFVEAPVDAPISNLLLFNNTISILCYDDGEWRLSGNDAVYADWIFRYNGVIRLSKAYQVRDHIQIIDGPLKDLEGQIIRLDRRNRNGQVAIHFGDNIIKVWLGFELINEYQEDVQRATAIRRASMTCTVSEECHNIHAGP